MDRRTVSGWTLVEVLTSMAIVFTLTGTVGHIGVQQVRRAQLLAAQQEVASITIALETYALDCGEYPTEAQGLPALWEPPVLHPVPTEWSGPYLFGPIEETPWGGRYTYETPGPEGRPYSIGFSDPPWRSLASGGTR